MTISCQVKNTYKIIVAKASSQDRFKTLQPLFVIVVALRIRRPPKTIYEINDMWSIGGLSLVLSWNS